MWNRVRKAHARRYAQVRLRVHRRDPAQRPPIGSVANRQAGEGISRRMVSGIKCIVASLKGRA